MQVICDKIRAIGIVDAPVGTTVQDAIKGRGPQGTINFNTSSDRIVLCYPHLKVYDSASDSNVLEPYSQRCKVPSDIDPINLYAFGRYNPELYKSKKSESACFLVEYLFLNLINAIIIFNLKLAVIFA